MAVDKQSLVGTRFLDRGEILALKVLDQHYLLLLDNIEIADHDRYLAESGQTGCGQSPMPGYHDTCGGYQQGLEYPLRADGVGKLLESGRVQLSAGVERIGSQGVD